MNYSYNKHFNFDAANKAAVHILKSFFNPNSVLINTPNFIITASTAGVSRNSATTSLSLPGTVPQVTVQLSYYLAPQRLSATQQNNTFFPQLNALVNVLTQSYETVLGQPVNVQLELVRQYRPYTDATIIAQYLAINVSKYPYARTINRLLNAVPLLNSIAWLKSTSSGSHTLNLSGIIGIKVQLSGLLTSQRNRSRNSVYTTSAGTFHKVSSTETENSHVKGITSGSTIKTFIDYGCYTSKSRLGAFTVKVWIATLS